MHVSRMTFPLYDWCRARCVVGLDGCEVRLCDPRARVRPCVPSVSRVCRLVSFYRYRYLRLWENCGNGPMEHALLAGTVQESRKKVSQRGDRANPT